MFLRYILKYSRENHANICNQNSIEKHSHSNDLPCNVVKLTKRKNA